MLIFKARLLLRSTSNIQQNKFLLTSLCYLHNPFHCLINNINRISLVTSKPVRKFGKIAQSEMNDAAKDNEIHMTTPELIVSHGYEAETHYVWTDDSYRLEVHRVVPPATNNKSTIINENKLIDSKLPSPLNPLNNNNNKSSRPAVLVHHGLLSSSADFVLLGPQKALAYVLYDNGYDVWLGNARGNRYSRYHKKYTTKDKEFWDFSWHEMGIYDVPAMIDYILEKTEQTNLLYIGYSQGTTTFFVMTSERPEYNAKVKGMVCLAPIAFLSNQRSPLLKCVVPMHIVMKWAQSYFNINQWFPRNKLQTDALGTLINNASENFAKSFCALWFYLVAGFGSDQLDKAMLPVIFGHFPSGASAKQIIHYSQSIQSGNFQNFDYGIGKNMVSYGSNEPPKYSLDRVKIPVAIFHSDNDFLNHPTDVETLAGALPNVIEKRKIKYAKFNHIDYLWGRDAKTLLYDDIIQVLKRF